MHQFFKSLLNQELRSGINGGGCFIQNQDTRQPHKDSGNGQQLPLSLRKGFSSISQIGIVTLRELTNEEVGIGCLCCLDYQFPSRDRACAPRLRGSFRSPDAPAKAPSPPPPRPRPAKETRF